MLTNPILYLQTFLASFGRAAREDLAHTQHFYTTGLGYMREQSTKPQTLGYGLADSPVGLLAWIYEKLVGWSDAYPWTDDESGSSTPSSVPAYPC